MFLCDECIDLSRELDDSCQGHSLVNPDLSFLSRELSLKTRLCGFTQIHTLYSGSSIEEELWFPDMSPGIGLDAEVLA